MLKNPMCFMAFIVLVSLAGTAQAQIVYQRYVPPSGPVLPYYLDYFRPQSGVLDQYNQFVAPKARMENQVRSIVQQQRINFQAVQAQINQSGQIRPSTAAATGTAAGFMNYSHYYGSPVGAATYAMPGGRQ